MGKSIQIKMSDGFALGAYQATHVGDCKGTVIILQEVFGVNSHIRAVADGYAAEGYFALAPQLFDRIERNIEMGYEEADIARGIELAFEKLDPAQVLSDIQDTINHAVGNGTIATIGYCWGGLLSWLSACQLQGLSAAVAYYGGGIGDRKDLQPKCAVLMHFGDKDSYIPLSDVEAIRAAQPQPYPPVQVHVYSAEHGFNCDHRSSYDKASADLARSRTLEFLHLQLV